VGGGSKWGTDIACPFTDYHQQPQHFPFPTVFTPNQAHYLPVRLAAMRGRDAALRALCCLAAALKRQLAEAGGDKDDEDKDGGAAMQ